MVIGLARPTEWRLPGDLPSVVRTLVTGLREDDAQAERVIAWVRGICGVLCAPLVPFLGIRPFEPILGTIAFTLLWSAALLGYVIPRRRSWLRSGYLSAVLDTVTISLAVSQTGGIESPFYVVYYATASIHAVRFSGWRVLGLTPLVVAGYLLAVAAHGDPLGDDWALIAFRMFWGVTLALFVGVAVERARMAETALAGELERARALLQAAHAPAASLTVEGVLSAIGEQTRALTEADSVVVRIDDDGPHGPECRVVVGEGPAHCALVRMTRGSARARSALLAAREPMSGPDLLGEVPQVGPDIARFTSLLAVSIPGEQRAAGCVIVGRLHEPRLAAVHIEALNTFVERAALALQNARLYEQAQTQMDELQGLHEQIVRAERLAVVGELAAKVAHEINNPLTSIHMYNSLILEEPVGPDEQRRLAANVQEQVERAKRVVRDILDFSRPHDPNPEIVSINVAVEGGLALVRHAAAAAGVAIKENYVQGLPTIRVDREQLSQVLVNLTSNAIDVMDKGGILTITTGAWGDEVYVEVRDTGPGIAPEHLRRIFEPFFSTKPRGRGTGLGLAVCRTLVTRQHGRITVKSILGGGSAFTIWLPPVLAQEGQGA